jgi:hypothetical protein
MQDHERQISSSARPAQAPHQPQAGGGDLTASQIGQLLARSEKAARSGNYEGARALLRAITRQYADEVRAWRLLSFIAATPDEREHALEQVRRLEAQATQTAGSSTAIAAAGTSQHPTSTPVPETSATRADSPRHYTMLWVSLTAVGMVLVALFWGRLLVNMDDQASATPSSGVAIVSDDPPGNQENSQADNQQASHTVIPPTPIPTSTSVPTPTPTYTPTPVPRPTTHTLGTVLSHDNWYATLIRPDHAQLFSETISGVSAQGRFALAVLAVGNTAPQPRRIPGDMFALIDDQGRLYHPIEGASSAYLSTYGRGQVGDLALEDEIPAGGGSVSVPLLFDVASDVNELFLTMGQQPTSGWQIPIPTEQSDTTQPAATPDAAP